MYRSIQFNIDVAIQGIKISIMFQLLNNWCREHEKSFDSGSEDKMNP